MPKLLSDEELREQINIALTEFKAKVLLSTAKDNEEAYSFGNNRLFDLINNQKQLFAESVIGKDEVWKENKDGILEGIEIERVWAKNKLRAEQRARIK